MTYTPREGSIPDRAVQIIQAFGQPMPARILADRLEVDRKNINILLSAAIKHGALKREPINNIVHYGMPTMTFNTIPPSEWGPPGNAKKAEPVKTDAEEKKGKPLPSKIDPSETQGRSVSLRNNDLPAELLKELRPDGHLPPRLRERHAPTENKGLTDQPNKSVVNSVESIVNQTDIDDKRPIKFAEYAEHPETHINPGPLKYGYHSDGVITISKGEGNVSLHVDECTEISEFFETMMHFHKRRAA